MTHKLNPCLSRTVLAASIAAIWVAGQSAAWAQDADEIRSLTRPGNTVELGVGFTNANSFKFGDYTGMNDKGAYLISNIELNHRNEANTHYFSLTGLNLGLDSRNLKLEGGEQGNYGLSLEYDEIPKLSLDSYQTPFLNPGSTNLALPTSWTRLSNTGTTFGGTSMRTQINNNMRSFDIKTERNSLSFGLTKELARGWDTVLRIKREKKDGSRLIGAVMGNSGGNPRAALLPEPIDYTTDELEAQLRYTDKKLQLQFAYFGSYFDNANRSLVWSNPFAPVGTPTLSGWATDTALGQIGLPPDNRAHQISAAGGYSFTSDTRLSGSVSLGRMTQNDAFLPYTINSGLTNPAFPLRTSLDGRVDTTHMDVKLSSKLTPKLHASAGYRYDERDNKTPQATYRYVGGDSILQYTNLDNNSPKIRTNLPGSSTKQQIEAHLDYHLAPDTKLKLGYDYEWAEKTFEAITEEKEHTVKAEVNQHFSDMVSGGLSYAYSDRKTRAANGSDYDGSAPFLASFTPEYAASRISSDPVVNGQWDNLPTQYKYIMAPRKRDKVRAFLNVMPTDKIDLQAAIDYKNDDFHKSQYGLQKAKGWAVNLDANYVVSDTLTGHVFASFDKYTTGQRSYQFDGSSKAITAGRDWTADIDDRTSTFGIGARYTPSSKFQIGGDITHASSTGSTSVYSQRVATLVGPMPDLKTKLTRLDLFGQYQVQKNLAVKMKYIYERYSSADWSIDQVTATTMANVIGTNQTSPQYDVHFVGISLAYDF